MGPFAQGPVALIARHADECVFSADALGLRPLWQVETEDDFVFSSEPGVVSVHAMVSEPKPLAPGEKALVLIDRERKRSTLHAARRDAADRPRQLAARATASTRPPATTARWRPAGRSRARTSPATPTPAPRSRSRSPTASSPASAGSATTSNWSSRWPPTGPSRSARSATTGRWRRSRPSARTSPTTSRRRSPSSPTRRSTASARWSTSRPGRCSAAGPRSTPPARTPARSKPRSR